MFTLDNTTDFLWESPHLKAHRWELERTTAIFDLVVTISHIKHGLQGTIEYNKKLFDPDTITSMWIHFTNILDTLKTSSDITLMDIPMQPVNSQRKIFDRRGAQEEFEVHQFKF
jgi:hypothetical protein